MNWIQVLLIASIIGLLFYLLRSRRSAVACLGQGGLCLVRARRHLCRAETGRHHSGRKLVWGAPRHRPDALRTGDGVQFHHTEHLHAVQGPRVTLRAHRPGSGARAHRRPNSAGKTQPLEGAQAPELSRDSICADRSQEGPGGLQFLELLHL